MILLYTEESKSSDEIDNDSGFNNKDDSAFDSIRDFLESISSSTEALKKVMKENLSELDFSFYVSFSPDNQGRHLKLIKIIDNISSACISYKPTIKYKFSNENDWKISWKLFDDFKLNSLFEDLCLSYEYIFAYIYLTLSDISRELTSVLWLYTKNVLEVDEFWNSFSLDEKKEILLKVLVQLIKFFKYFNVVIRSHFSILNLNSPRYIPEYKYILKNGKMPDIKDYKDLNIFLPKKEAEILSSEEDTAEYIELMTESEHLMWSDIFYFLSEYDLAKYCYLKKNRETGELRIVNMEGIDHNFTEAGSGFLNFFPLLFQIYYRTKIDYLNHYIFIENPELHLNSNHLAALSSLLTSEDVPLIVETNSEQLIKKIQMQIFKGELKRDEISFLYFQNSKGQTKIEELKIDKKSISKYSSAVRLIRYNLSCSKIPDRSKNELTGFDSPQFYVSYPSYLS